MFVIRVMGSELIGIQGCFFSSPYHITLAILIFAPNIHLLVAGAAVDDLESVKIGIFATNLMV